MPNLKQALDNAGPNSIPDHLRKIKLGSLIQGHMPQGAHNVNFDAAGADPFNLATLDVLKLPDEGKAAHLLAAYGRVGTAGTGKMTLVAKDATPATGEIAITPTGDIATLAADALKSVDLWYVPMGKARVLELVLPVVAHVLTLPTEHTSVGGAKPVVPVLLVLEATALDATAAGDKVVLAHGAGAPAAGQCRLNVGNTTVTFAAADVVTRARVRLLVGLSDADQIAGQLEAASNAF